MASVPRPTLPASPASPGGPRPGSPPRLAPAGPYPKLPELEDLPAVAGRRVLVRCDFNVPVRRGRVVDDLRIRAATPTLEWLARRGAQVTVCTHLGRPGGRRDDRFDMAPVRDRLAELVPGVELVDNLRFQAGEEANDPRFVERLIERQDLYVNDAFASCHREHASVMGPPLRLPSAAGRLVSREVAVLSALRAKPRRPFVAVLGGPADPERLAGIEALMEFVDAVALGGPLAFSLLAGGAWERWAGPVRTGRLVLPSDVVITRDGDRSSVQAAAWDSVPAGWSAADIGHRTQARYSGLIGGAGTVLWDGTMSEDGYVSGTRAVAEAVAGAAAFTVASGVDTLEGLSRMRLSPFIDHVSTGGAATLAFLRDGDLPGLQAIRRLAPV